MKNSQVTPQNHKIAILGAGHVGLVSAACFAELGHLVICLDTDEERISSLCTGTLPFYEPGLEDLVHKHSATGNLIFTTRYDLAVSGAEFIFIAVGTPTSASGYPDLRNVQEAGEAIKRALRGERPIIVTKSTGPVGINNILSSLSDLDGFASRISLVANPEFLREGSAVADFMNPDRVVLGSDDPEARAAVGLLYEPLEKPIIYTDMNSAEMIKYASNAFLATKISFINEIGQICERIGANVQDVAKGIGLDHRIGSHFLNAGVGFGGSCLPKDVTALASLGSVDGSRSELLSAVLEINLEQRRRLVRRLREVLGGLRRSRIAMMGLAFKPETDDIRDAPALDLIELLESEGAEVIACDPVATKKAQRALPHLRYETDPYIAATGCDAILVATEWRQFRDLDLKKLHSVMRTPVIADGRNIFDPSIVRDSGFIYFGVGLAHKETISRRIAIAPL